MGCNIMVVRIGERLGTSPKVQEVLSRFGCLIRARLGLHEAESACPDEGVLILRLTGEKDEMKALEASLNKLESVKAKLVTLD